MPDQAEELDRLKAALADRYRIERELGRGGMATVYLAEDLKLDRPVAIKVLRPELTAAIGSERFLREIKLTARLEHPHILTLHDSGESDGFLYYVMPYVDGESLRERLNREHQLPVEDSVRIAREVADALDYAHGHEVVHRDIKPENILLAGRHAVVADFGVARAIDAAGGGTLTETGVAIGTPTYMSPEQAGGHRALDGRSDIYSLGCLTYEMLGGEPPFTGPSAQAVLARHSLDPVPRLRTVRETVPEALEAAVLRALAKVPADRFATARELAEALEHAAAGASPLAPPRQQMPRRHLVIAAGAVLVALTAAWWGVTWLRPPSPHINSLAVLPFKNLMGDPEQEYFVQGIHEALTAELSKIGALKVISRTSAMRYRDTDKAMPQIARELGVDGLIEASVLREGDQVRLTVQLIHGPSDRHLWADSYQRELRSVLALQSELARAIAEQIQVTLTPEEARRLTTMGVVDAEAQDDYLRGRYQWNKWNLGGWEAAARHFQQSIDKDPLYAPARAMLGLTYSWLGYYSRMPPSVLHSRALAAAERAVALDPSLAEAYASLGQVKTSFDWDWAAADQASREALGLDASSTTVLLSRAFFLMCVGRHAEAIAIAERAAEQDPVAPHVNNLLGMHYFMARRYDEAVDQLNKVLELEPDYRDAHIWLSYSYARIGKFEEAAEESARVTGYRQSWWPNAWILAVTARSREAREVLEQVPAEETRRPVDAYFLALVLAELGEKDRAFAALEQAYQGRTALMSILKVDPRLDALRDDPRFGELLRRMNFPH